MTAESWHRWEGASLFLQIRVQPRASKDELGGVHNGRLKVRLTAPPIEGKANAKLVQYLAELFRVPKSNVTLIAGERGREKKNLHRESVAAPRHRPATARSVNAVAIEYRQT